MTDNGTFPLPETIPDYLGRPVRVGDTIAYGALIGRGGGISVGKVLGFQWQKSKYYYGKEGEPPPLKIRVQGDEISWRGERVQKAPGLLEANLRRFVRIEAPE
jgi:hypothetical protein